MVKTSIEVRFKVTLRKDGTVKLKAVRDNVTYPFDICETEGKAVQETYDRFFTTLKVSVQELLKK